MKSILLKFAVVAILFILTACIVSALLVALDLGIAYVLTKVVHNLETREAVVSGAILAGFVLHFCFKFFSHVLIERESSYLCDECAEASKMQNQSSVVVPHSYIFGDAPRRQSRRKTPRNK